MASWMRRSSAASAKRLAFFAAAVSLPAAPLPFAVDRLLVVALVAVVVVVTVLGVAEAGVGGREGMRKRDVDA